MYVNLTFENLNSGLYPPHLTSTYTYEMTIVPRVRGEMFLVFYFEDKISMLFSKKERKNRYVWVYTRKSLHK